MDKNDDDDINIEEDVFIQEHYDNWYYTTSVSEFCKEVGVTDAIIKSGLSRNEVIKRRNAQDDDIHTLSSPISCIPSYICCLLPCLSSLPSVKEFNARIPRQVRVKRKNTTMIMDVAGLVLNDIVLLQPSDIVSADLRLIKTSIDLVIKSDLISHTNKIALMGSNVISGTATGIVIAVGKESLWGMTLERKGSQRESQNLLL